MFYAGVSNKFSVLCVMRRYCRTEHAKIGIHFQYLMVFWFTGENTGERLNSVVAPECSCYHLEQLKQPTHLYIIIYINLQ